MHNAQEIRINSGLDKEEEYERNCLQHVKRMFRNRLPGIIKKAIHQKAEETRGDR